VQAVVDLAASEPPASFPRDIIYCRVPLCDGAENTAAVLQLAVSTTVALVRAKVPTLVACSMGMSRSPAVAAAALAEIENCRPDEVLTRIAKSGPLDVDTALWRDLQRLD
jgi:protein-tyrosine phosphatase